MAIFRHPGFHWRTVHQMLSLLFPAQCTKRRATGLTFHLPVGSYVRPPSVPVLYAVCSVTFKGSPSLNKYWSGLHPRLEARGADSCRSDGRASAGGISVDTGTHERVANWSPDIVDAVDPCDPGTDPKNGPFAGIPHGCIFEPGHGRYGVRVGGGTSQLVLLVGRGQLTMASA